ncbi:MAG TPA: hypothetical protein VLV83_18415 [Acidobacteriota bacterium]|nr:hypothetical protein [Acidobacteriota bacterium]
MNLNPNEAIHDSVRGFISETPDLTEWAQSLDQEDLLQELELVEYSLQSGTLIAPPSSLVGLVQKAERRKWKETLETLRPFLPGNLGSSEAEMCAIGLVWCELLMDTCSTVHGNTEALQRVFGLSYSPRM